MLEPEPESPTNMSSGNAKASVAVNHRTGRKGQGRKPAYEPKIYISPITEIARATFNTGHSKFMSQFKTSRRDVTDYLQRTLEHGHDMAMTLITGEEQTIELPSRIDKTSFTEEQVKAGELDDMKLTRTGMVATMAKGQTNLKRNMKKGFTTVISQCR